MSKQFELFIDYYQYEKSPCFERNIYDDFRKQNVSIRKSNFYYRIKILIIL